MDELGKCVWLLSAAIWMVPPRWSPPKWCQTTSLINLIKTTWLMCRESLLLKLRHCLAASFEHQTTISMQKLKKNLWQAEPALHSIRMNQSLRHINHWFPWIRGPGNNTPYFWGGLQGMTNGDWRLHTRLHHDPNRNPGSAREPQKKLEEKPAYQKLPTKCR